MCSGQLPCVLIRRPTVPYRQNKRLFSPELIAHNWHWISGSPPKKLLESGSNPAHVDEFPFTAQIRHRQTPRKALLKCAPTTVANVGPAGQVCILKHIICWIWLIEPCAIEPVLDAMSPSTTFRVRFKDLQRAIAPGQVRKGAGQGY